MKKRKILKRVIGVAVIFFTALYISTCWYQVALIQGDSMLPTYHSWQLVLLDKHTKEYTCGDVVAFRCEGIKGVLIKRIAAGPGDTVRIADGILYRNGLPVQEEFGNGKLDFAGIAGQTITLSQGEYFLLGDHYAVSRDCRYEEIGCIPKENIIGKVIP